MSNKTITIPYGEFVYGDQEIRFTVTDLEPTEAHIREYTDTLRLCMESQSGPFVYLVDGTLGKWLSSNARIEMGNGSKKLELDFGDKHVKTVIVINNPIVKMMLKGVNLVIKPTIPQEVYTNLADAEEAMERTIASFDRKVAV